jgi:hypothetical protein
MEGVFLGVGDVERLRGGPSGSEFSEGSGLEGGSLSMSSSGQPFLFRRITPFGPHLWMKQFRQLVELSSNSGGRGEGRKEQLGYLHNRPCNSNQFMRCLRFSTEINL